MHKMIDMQSFLCQCLTLPPSCCFHNIHALGHHPSGTNCFSPMCFTAGRMPGAVNEPLFGHHKYDKISDLGEGAFGFVQLARNRYSPFPPELQLTGMALGAETSFNDCSWSRCCLSFFCQLCKSALRVSSAGQHWSTFHVFIM